MADIELHVRAFRNNFASWLLRVHYGGDRLCLATRGFYSGGVISLDDLELLRRTLPMAEGGVEFPMKVGQARADLANAIRSCEHRGDRIRITRNRRDFAALVGWREMRRLRELRPLPLQLAA